MDLISQRKKIDKLDREIASLLRRRLDVSKDIRKYKKSNKMKSTDKKRESEIINRINCSGFPKGYIKQIYSTVFKYSKKA